MVVLQKWRLGSEELSNKMSPELSEEWYFSVSKFTPTCSLISFSFVCNSIRIQSMALIIVQYLEANKQTKRNSSSYIVKEMTETDRFVLSSIL